MNSSSGSLTTKLRNFYLVTIKLNNHAMLSHIFQMSYIVLGRPMEGMTKEDLRQLNPARPPKCSPNHLGIVIIENSDADFVIAIQVVMTFRNEQDRRRQHRAEPEPCPDRLWSHQPLKYAEARRAPLPDHTELP